MTAWKLTLAVTVTLVCAVGCSSGQPDLPDRSTPAVKGEESRIAALLGADRSIVAGPGKCIVRLLGQEAGASFVWADCGALDPPYTAVSVPLRVDGSKVTLPRDGAAFADSVRELFPEELAEFVLDNKDSAEIRP